MKYQPTTDLPDEASAKLEASAKSENFHGGRSMVEG
jgi:hypothetical protein